MLRWISLASLSVVFACASRTAPDQQPAAPPQGDVAAADAEHLPTDPPDAPAPPDSDQPPPPTGGEALPPTTSSPPAQKCADPHPPAPNFCKNGARPTARIDASSGCVTGFVCPATPPPSTP